MTSEPIFQLASRHAQWTAIRQAVVGSNIANQNVVGYGARKVADFQSAIDSVMQVKPAATHPQHFGIDLQALAAPEPSVDVTNRSVTLETELAEATAVKKDMQLNLAITSAFHRMTMLAARF